MSRLVAEAVILRPYYPASSLFQLQRERDGLQIDFMGKIDGVKSYESLRGRAGQFEIGGQKLLAAGLDDIVSSKRAAGRPKDLAVIAIPKKHAMRKQKPAKQPDAVDARAALQFESERALLELIRYRLSLPPQKRLNCLRRKIGCGLLVSEPRSGLKPRFMHGAGKGKNGRR